MSWFLQTVFDFERKPAELLTVDEIYQRADEMLLQALREDRRLERKSPRIHGEALGEYFSMWANTAPDGGIIVIGQEDDGSFTGLSSIDQAALNKLEHGGDTYCPGAKYETQRVEVTSAEGKKDFVLLIRVFSRPDRVVETVKGHAFVRRGDTKRRLTDDEKRELRFDKGEVNFEQEACRLEYPEDFDADAIHHFGENVRTAVDISDRSDVEILAIRHLGVLKGDHFTPNLACALLFAKEPDRLVPGCKIRFLRFDGEHEGTGEKFNAVKDIWIEGGGLPHLIQETEQVVTSQVRTFSVLGKDGKFYSTPEYPQSAWYEAIVNACVHRSYGNSLKNVHITVKMFDDRLEIESPGPFPAFVTPENIYGNPHPRNPKLAFAMYYMKFVKMAAEGTRRMRDTMREMNLQDPEFSQKEIDCSRVRVTLRNNIKQRKVWVDSDVAAVIGDAIAGTLTRDEKRVVNFVAEHKKVNVSQVQRLTQLTWPAAKKLLTRLQEKGILHHVHRDDVDRDSAAHFVLANGNAS